MGSDGNCGFRVVSDLLGKGEENHTLVRQTLISELTMHKELYTWLYVTTKSFNKVHNVFAWNLDYSGCLNALILFLVFGLRLD